MEQTQHTHSRLSREATEELLRILCHGDPHGGESVRALEREFAEMVGVPHAVALNSGTAALHLALLAHGIGPGAHVITSPLCPPGVGCAIAATGATPVYADIDPYAYTISPLEAERAAGSLQLQNSQPGTHNTASSAAALLAVHLFGQPCDMAALSAIARRYGLALIEVAWDALGATFHGNHVGRHGTACYSFSHGSCVSTGGGGMLTTDDEVLAASVRRLANLGCDCCGRVRQPGFNYRMTEIVAALALAQLQDVGQRVELQSYWADQLTHGISGLRGLIPPAAAPGTVHAFQKYAVRVTRDFALNRQAVVHGLGNDGIVSTLYNHLPLHLQPFNRSRSDHATALTHAERAAEELMYLPLQPNIAPSSVERMIHVLRLMATSTVCPE